MCYISPFSFPGFCGMITYSWWANRVISEFVDPNFRAQKWVFQMWYDLFQSVSVWEFEPILVQIWTWSCGVCWLGRLSPPHLWGDGAGLLLRKRRPKIQVDITALDISLIPSLFFLRIVYLQYSSPNGPRRPGTYATARTRRTYMLPASASRGTMGPPLFYEGRKSRTTGATKTNQTFSRDSFVWTYLRSLNISGWFKSRVRFRRWFWKLALEFVTDRKSVV